MTKLTDEQKAKFAPMLKDTWQAIGFDCEELLPRGRQRVACVIELVIDADRPVTYGRMSRDDYRILCDSWKHRDTQKWLRKVLNY